MSHGGVPAGGARPSRLGPRQLHDVSVRPPDQPGFHHEPFRFTTSHFPPALSEPGLQPVGAVHGGAETGLSHAEEDCHRLAACAPWLRVLDRCLRGTQHSQHAGQSTAKGPVPWCPHGSLDETRGHSHVPTQLLPQDNGPWDLRWARGGQSRASQGLESSGHQFQGATWGPTGELQASAE